MADSTAENPLSWLGMSLKSHAPRWLVARGHVCLLSERLEHGRLDLLGILVLGQWVFHSCFEPMCEGDALFELTTANSLRPA